MEIKDWLKATGDIKKGIAKSIENRELPSILKAVILVGLVGFDVSKRRELEGKKRGNTM